MGPEPGTPKYKEQVEAITSALRDVPMEQDELSSFLMMWITDRAFSRAAICEAEKLVRRARGWLS